MLPRWRTRYFHRKTPGLWTLPAWILSPKYILHWIAFLRSQWFLQNLAIKLWHSKTAHNPAKRKDRTCNFFRSLQCSSACEIEPRKLRVRNSAPGSQHTRTQFLRILRPSPKTCWQGARRSSPGAFPVPWVPYGIPRVPLGDLSPWVGPSARRMFTRILLRIFSLLFNSCYYGKQGPRLFF